MHKDFPAWKFHHTDAAKIVHSAAEEEALGPEWVDSPEHVNIRVETPVEEQSAMLSVPEPVVEPTPGRRGRPPKVKE